MGRSTHIGGFLVCLLAGSACRQNRTAAVAELASAVNLQPTHTQRLRLAIEHVLDQDFLLRRAHLVEFDGDGYTNLEEYLNELVKDVYPPGYPVEPAMATLM